jgi:hypothetical protein
MAIAFRARESARLVPGLAESLLSLAPDPLQYFQFVIVPGATLDNLIN